MSSAFTVTRLRPFLERRVKFLLVAMPLTCLALLLPFDGWVMELARQFRFWCAGLAAVLAVFCLGLRLWRWLPVALVTAGWQGWPAWHYPAGSDAIPGHGSPAFTILSCNLLEECREPARMMAALAAADADVLVLLEFTPEWQAACRGGLWEKYPHRLEQPEPGGFGIALASRLPLREASIEWDPHDYACARAIVATGFGEVAVLGVHPMPPMLPGDYPQWRASFAAWPEMLRRTVAPHQVLAGDLNATPFCRTFQALCAATGLRDSAPRVRSTWFPGPSPCGLPLDHVLISSGLAVVDHRTGPELGSDHRWVSVRLAAAR